MKPDLTSFQVYPDRLKEDLRHLLILKHGIFQRVKHGIQRIKQGQTNLPVKSILRTVSCRSGIVRQPLFAKTGRTRGTGCRQTPTKDTIAVAITTAKRAGIRARKAKASPVRFMEDKI